MLAERSSHLSHILEGTGGQRKAEGKPGGKVGGRDSIGGRRADRPVLWAGRVAEDATWAPLPLQRQEYDSRTPDSCHCVLCEGAERALKAVGVSEPGPIPAEKRSVLPLQGGGSRLCKQLEEAQAAIPQTITGNT